MVGSIYACHRVEACKATFTTGLCNTTAGSNNNKSKTERAHCEETGASCHIFTTLMFLVENAIKQTTVIVQEKIQFIYGKARHVVTVQSAIKKDIISKI